MRCFEMPLHNIAWSCTKPVLKRPVGQGTYLFRPSRLPSPFQSAERFLPKALKQKALK